MKSQCLKSIEAFAAFILVSRKATIKIRELVQGLKAFESEVSDDKYSCYFDHLLEVARIKCEVVEAVKSYREQDRKSTSVDPQTTMRIPQDIKDSVGVINTDSTAGSKLCDLWIKKILAVIEQKAELGDQKWFFEVCTIIEAVNSTNNNYHQLAGTLLDCCEGEFGTLV